MDTLLYDAPHESLIPFTTGNEFPNNDLFLVDADSGKIKLLLSPDQAGILLSPDGNMDVVYTSEYIDVVGVYGQFKRRHMLTYQPEWNNEHKLEFWTRDSKKFMFVAPIHGNADPTDGPEPDVIWKFELGTNSPVKLQLDPPPMASYFAISPDGNWIVYSYFSFPGKNNDTTPAGIYIGNLQNGTSHMVESGDMYGFSYSYYWSPDSQHYVFLDYGGTGIYLGNTFGEITPTGGKNIIGWIDNNHYLYENDNICMGDVRKQGCLRVIDLPASINDPYAANLVYVYVEPK